jgi:hypothetical protein
MFSPVIQEFAFSLPADSYLLRAQVTAGEPIDQAEVLSLMAIAQSLFVSTTLESRTLNRVEDCHQLWSEAAGLFSELCDSWGGIPKSDDPNIHWLRSRLEHFRSLSEDRCELYHITEKERLEHAKCKEAEMSDPEPVREFSRMETPHRYGRQYGRWNVARKATE